MSGLCRIRQTRLKYLCSQFKRTYIQVSSPSLSDYVTHDKLPSSLNYRLNCGLLGRSNEVFDNVRFFAVPAQFKKKEEESKKLKGPRLNGQIKSHMVRLVIGEGHEIVPLHVAMEKAKKLNLDLVEVDHNAQPIVCKLMDFHREKYQQHLKEKQRSKIKAETAVRKGPPKEVRFTPKIEQKDLQMKADTAKRLMESGYRVKCMVVGIKGKEGQKVQIDEKEPKDENERKEKERLEIERKLKEQKEKEEKLRLMIDRLHALIEDVAFVESGPRVEKNQAFIVVRHIKFGPSKKGGKGGAKSADASRSAPSTGEVSVSEDSGSETDSELTPEPPQLKWPLSDTNGADKKAFDFGYDSKDGDRILIREKKPFLESASPHIANSTENRYSRQEPTRFRQGGPDRAQMPRVPNFVGSTSNSSENRYSRPDSPRRGPPGAERYTHPGPDPRNFSSPPQREIPKHNPVSSDYGPPSSNYGMFSNPNASLPRNPSSTNAQAPSTENPEYPPTTGFTNR